MGQTAGDDGQKTGDSEPLSASAAYDGDSSCIGAARHLATGFLTDVQAVHGVRVSERALGMTQLVVSELVTNAVKYAPGPVMLDGMTWADPKPARRAPASWTTGTVCPPGSAR
ncbi:hypothetical protein AB0945_33265 [Streptomyces sp. NPDC005474]|uniref:hypothetical protein n=1 Tax=Streptomyces sp. NPDC005474 TaxID=3154878 RepID=UPI0034563374